MPSGSKKRKSAKKSKQDSVLFENARPGESPAESEENIENQSGLQEDYEDGTLTPKTPTRLDESEGEESACMQNDERVTTSEQNLGNPTSQAKTAIQSEENYVATPLETPLDWQNIPDITTSSLSGDNMSHRNSNVDSIHEGRAEDLEAHETLEGMHLGDRANLDSSAESHNLVDCGASLSTEQALAEPFAKASRETVPDRKFEGQLDFGEPDHTDMMTEESAEENQLTSVTQETMESKSQENIVEPEYADVRTEDPAEQSVTSEIGGAEEMKPQGVVDCEYADKRTEEPGDEIQLSSETDKAAEFKSREETPAAAVEFVGDPSMTVEEMKTNHELESQQNVMPEGKSLEEMPGDVEPPVEPNAHLELESQKQVVEHDARPLTAPADESSSESALQEETSMAMTKGSGETTEGSELEVQQEPLNLDSIPLTVPMDESLVDSTTVTVPGETIAGPESEHRKEDSELDSKTGTSATDEIAMKLNFQEDTSGAAVEDFGDSGAELKSDDQQEVSELDATLLSHESQEKAGEETFTVDMETDKENNPVLELGDQPEVSKQDDRSFTALSSESSFNMEPQESFTTTVDIPGEISAKLGVVEGEPQGFEPAAEPLDSPPVERPGHWRSPEETCVTARDASEEFDCQVAGSEVDATPLIEPADGSSLESSSQEETSVTGVETTGEAHSDLGLHADATPPAVPAGESFVESKPQEETSVITVEHSEEASSDLEIGGQQDVLGVDARQCTVPTVESSATPEFQDETSKTALEGLMGTDADLEFEVQPEVLETEATPPVLADESSVYSEEKASNVVGEAPQETSLDSEFTDHQEDLERNATPLLSKPADDKITESRYQEEICTTGETEADFETSDQQGTKELKGADSVHAEENQVTEFFGNKGEPSANNFGKTELVQDNSQLPVVAHSSDSNIKQEGSSDFIPESAEVGHSQEESEPLMTVSKGNIDDKQVSCGEFERRAEAVNGTDYGVSNEETAPHKEMAEPVNDEDGKGVITLKRDGLNLADESILQGMPSSVEDDSAKYIIQERGTPENIEGESYVDTKDEVNFLHDSGMHNDATNERNLSTPGNCSIMAANGGHPTDPAAGTESDDEKIEQAQELKSKHATVPGDKRLESSDMLEDTLQGAETSKIPVRKEEESARTQELDVGQGNGPIVRQPIHKTKWWECCGVFDALLSKG